jgi:hypothetical protein
MKLPILFLLTFAGTSARADDFGIVFDPPSNVRASPDLSSAIQCTVTVKNRTIKTYSTNGPWFETDACGQRGWIHTTQIHTYTQARVKTAQASVRKTTSTSAVVLCKADGGVRVTKHQGNWFATDYCGGLGWINASDVDTGPIASSTSSGSQKLITASAPSCTGSTDCTNAGVLPVCADAATAACVSNKCEYTRSLQSTCPCYAGEVRECPTNGQEFNYCFVTAPNQTIWQVSGSTPVCGPTQVACNPQLPDCTTGHATTSFDSGSSTWVAGSCQPDPSCPQVGSSRQCNTGNALCPTGLQTYSSAGWSTCVPVGDCTPHAPTYVVDPQGGPTVNVSSVTCLGSGTTGPPYPKKSAAITEEGTGKVTTLENAGSMAFNLTSSQFKNARVQVTFDASNQVTQVQFLTITYRNVVSDAALGTIADTGGQLVLQRVGLPSLVLSGTDREMTRLRHSLVLHCGQPVVIGKYLTASSFQVDSDDTFGDMGYWRVP